MSKVEKPNILGARLSQIRNTMPSSLDNVRTNGQQEYPGSVHQTQFQNSDPYTLNKRNLVLEN